MGIVEGTTLGLLTITSLYLVWAAIRHQEREIGRRQSRWQCEQCRRFSPTVAPARGGLLCTECAGSDDE